MINHFNAFISYKHAELDNKIAASIVKDLERFHIPKKIQKATGVKKIERIFRDKDELPITSDLGDTISQALEKSDFLIVICSHNTRLSTWVEREIEYFLQNHSMNRILTVLCEGEPNEVIPEVLLKGKDIFVDENGVEHTREIPYEPLSCDYRMPYRKAKAEELPRLAAALIGCSYDELINRQRQYRMRRMGAIFATALAITVGFAGYMLYSNTLIQRNYQESLRNQSRYLANESEKLLDDENRIEAMQLALAALPGGEEDERPVIPEAERAITKASYSYVSLEGSNIGAVWNYRMPGRVRNFKVSEEGSYFAAMDQNGGAMVWKTDESHEMIFYEDNAADKGTDFFFLGDDRLILLCQKSVSAFDLDSKELLWKLQDDQSKLIFVRDVFALPGGDLLLPGSAGNVDIISGDDGSLKKSFSLFEDDNISSTVTDYVMSEDGTVLFYILADKSDINNYIYSLCRYDLASGQQLVKDDIGTWPSRILASGDNIYLACKEESYESSVQLMNFRFVTEDKAEIRCISSEDLSDKWTSEITASDVYFNAEFLPLEGGKIAYYEADTCRIWDAETGEIVGTYNTNDSIIDISDNDGDGEPMFITKGGATAAPAVFGQTLGVSVIDRFSGDLVDALVSNGVYALSDGGRQVIYYGTKVYDEEWKLIDEVPGFKTGSNYLLDENVLAITADEGESAEVIFVDPAQKTYMGQCVLGEDIPAYSYRLLGSFDEIFYAAVARSSVFEILKIDLENMTLEKEIINDDYGKYEPYCFLKNGKLLYLDTGEGFEYFIIQRNLATGEEKKVVFNNSFSDVCYIDAMDAVYINAATDLLADMSKEKISEMDLGDNFGEAALVASNSDGSILAVSDNEFIKLIGRDGEDIGEIFCGGVAPLDITFMDNNEKKIIVVAYSNGTLYRYDEDSLEFIGKSDLSVMGMSAASNKSFDYDSERGLLYFKNGDITDMVETDTWVEVASIFNSFGHDKKTDTFLTYGYDSVSSEGVVGYFKHYSVDDLIKKTKDYLHGEEMSVEQKSMYGITG